MTLSGLFSQTGQSSSRETKDIIQLFYRLSTMTSQLIYMSKIGGGVPLRPHIAHYYGIVTVLCIMMNK